MSDLPNPATIHQAFQALPKLDAPAVNLETGSFTQPWQRFLIRLWQMIGGATTTLQGAIYFTVDPATGNIIANNPATNKPSGMIPQPVPASRDATLSSLALIPPETPQAKPDRAFVVAPPPDPPPNSSWILITNPIVQA